MTISTEEYWKMTKEMILPQIAVKAPWRDMSSGGAPSGIAVEAETVKALVTAGFCAIQNNMVEPGTKIFEFLATVRPNADFVAIGLALAAMTDGRFADAATILAKAREFAPESEELKAFHVLALLLQKDFIAARESQASLAKNASGTGMTRFAECLEKEIVHQAMPRSGEWLGGLV
jgi:hypothetical protein